MLEDNKFLVLTNAFQATPNLGIGRKGLSEPNSPFERGLRGMFFC